MRITRITTRRDALYAVLAFCGGLLLLKVRGYATWDSRNPPDAYLRVIPLFGMCVGMLFRRTAPMVGLAVSSAANLMDIYNGPSLGSATIYTDALYSAVVYGPRRAHRGLLVGTLAASVLVVISSWMYFGQFQLAVVLGAISGTTWVAPVLTGLIIVEHREKARAERLRAEQVARLAELDRRSAVTAERARMARELHDVIANHLSAVALHSSAVLRMRDMDRATMDRSLEVIRENSVQGLAEMRRMIGLLREGDAGADEPEAPRLAGVERLVALTARSDLTAGLTATGTPPELPAAVELAAYRIVQESLTNALKHAGPGRAEVRLEYRPDGVAVAVDSPLGDDRARLPGSGAGLIGMRERASVLGGTFSAGPEGDRWRVRAELPLEAAGPARKETENA